MIFFRIHIPRGIRREQKSHLYQIEVTLFGQFDGKIYNHDYSQTDIYTVNVESRDIKRITNTEFNESHPVWSNTKKVILYTADYNGVWNLFIHPLEIYDPQTGNKNIFKQYPITNVLLRVYSNQLCPEMIILLFFAGYSGIGWDLYSISNPLSLKKNLAVAPTQFILNSESQGEDIVDLRGHKNNRNLSMDESTGSYSNWVFARGYESFNSPVEKGKDDYAAISTDTTKIDGQYISKSYKTRFTLDLVSGNLQLSNVFGATGMTYFLSVTY